MSKCGSVYYLVDAEVEGQRPNAVFLGALFDSKKDPDGPRKILNLSKYEPGRGNEPQIRKAVSITYSDGSVEHIADKVLICKLATYGGDEPRRKAKEPDPNEFSDEIGF